MYFFPSFFLIVLRFNSLDHVVRIYPRIRRAGREILKSCNAVRVHPRMYEAVICVTIITANLIGSSPCGWGRHYIEQ